jgi:hypothetical protein
VSGGAAAGRILQIARANFAVPAERRYSER